MYKDCKRDREGGGVRSMDYFGFYCNIFYYFAIFWRMSWNISMLILMQKKKT